MPKNAPQQNSPKLPHPFPPGEVVDPKWLLKALALVLAFAVFCSWVLVCVVFAKTQWQFVLHPSHEVKSTPAALHLDFSEVRFGPDDSGQPQLSGWWIPSDTPTDPTVILLHNGEGSMSDALPQADTLHQARLNVLLFDYRGFGTSGGQHPTQVLMQQDATSALTYLTETRKIPVSTIVVYADGIATSLAVRLAAEHKELPAVILHDVDGDLTDRVAHDFRARLVPVRLLFDQQFPVDAPLHTLATPKLIFAHRNPAVSPHRAADPKMMVTLSDDHNAQVIHDAIHRFLDEYLR